MITYFRLKMIAGCLRWVRVTTDYATWASLRHVAVPVVGACVAIAVIPPAYHPTPMPPAPPPIERVYAPPGSTIYYPPGHPDNGPDVPRQVDYQPHHEEPPVWCPPDQPTPVPEPATLAIFGAGIVALGIVRRRRP